MEEVLVIDDNRMTRGFLTLLLESEGYAVRCCADGPSAIDLSKENDFRTFLIDYKMPGMNGDEVTLALRRSYPKSFIIGFSLEDKDRAFLVAGADAFISKGDLSTKLTRLIRGGSGKVIQGEHSVEPPPAGAGGSH